MKKALTTLLTLLIFSISFAAPPKAQKAKYIFFFIGDGMGIAHVTATEAYLADCDNTIGSKNVLFSNFPYTGFVTTFSANQFVTCSSAAGTALSTGHKTNNGMLGVDPNENPLKMITYKLKEKGYAIGVTTNVSVDHATPASFYAHNKDRRDYYNIACEIPQTNFDFFAGGGFYYPKGKAKNMPLLDSVVAKGGYKIARGVAEYDALSKIGAQKIILFNNPGGQSNLPLAIDRKTGDLSLAQVVDKAITHLSKQKSKGFFLMSEGGMIDFAAHDNDAAIVVKEVIDLSDAVKRAYDFYLQHPKETLIIVTADHETGGMTMSINGAKKARFSNLNGLKSSEESKNKGVVDSINKAAGIGFTTVGHTGIVVPIYAVGVGAELFTGKMDNTDIPKKLMQAAGFDF